MEKNYAIMAVCYDALRKHITCCKIKRNALNKLENEQIVSRQTIINSIENDRLGFWTVYSKNGGLYWGAEVSVVSLSNNKFLRTDKNEKEEDNLGDIPEFEYRR